ncbi:hypothetical protein EV368DRAFT_79914 [Lentinula lateritia]|nr:hypothetical protein EV368DRAFT_79914 [Lentinula lateritia]
MPPFQPKIPVASLSIKVIETLTLVDRRAETVSRSLDSAHSELQDWSNDYEYWDLNKPSADNSTAILVFSTASSLLQLSIPNPRFRNGHTIIPGIRIFGGAENCWLHNFVVDRPLRVLYIDGSGTALAAFPQGSVDGQDIFAWGEIKPNMALNEGLRIHKSGRRNWDWDGFKGKFSNCYVQLDLTHLVSFYDTTLAPPLIHVRFGRPRLAHRLLGIDADDIVRVRKYLEEQITETPWSSSRPETVEHGMDWPAYLHSIINLYGKPREDIWVIINSTWPQSDVQPNNQDTQVKSAFRLIKYTVQRFILYSISPTGNASDFARASPVYKECALTPTSSISTMSRTKSEALLRNAVERTTCELCRVLTKMWAMGVHEGLSSLFDSNVIRTSSCTEYSFGCLDTRARGFDTMA